MGSVLKTWMVVTIHPDFLITNFYNEFAMGLSTETIFFSNCNCLSKSFTKFAKGRLSHLLKIQLALTIFPPGGHFNSAGFPRVLEQLEQVFEFRLCYFNLCLDFLPALI